MISDKTPNPKAERMSDEEFALRPQYVICISHTHSDLEGKYWCGRSFNGFAFVDLHHATYETLRGGRLTACDECVTEAKRILDLAILDKSDQDRSIRGWYEGEEEEE